MVAILAAAAPAAASTTVGSSSLSSVGSPSLTCSSFPCVLVLDKVDGGAVETPKGVITSWSVRRAAGTVALRVLRSRPGQFVPDELHATNVTESADRTGSGTDTVQTFQAHQAVAAEDYIGITLVSGSSVGYLVGAGDQIFEVDGDLANFGDDVNSTAPENFEPLLSATIEPDADSDGYGDESEDGCPTNAATNGACPVITPFVPPFVPPKVSTAATRKVGVGARSTTLKGGRAAITLKNANAVDVKGKLKLKLGRKVVGSGSYKLAAGDTATFRVRLARAALRRIAKRGKVKLSLGLTAKGATGKTFKTTSKLTVKRAAKKKRKKRRAKRKQGGGGSALDGKYEKDPSSAQSIRFTVTSGGRRIVNLTGSVGAFCYTYIPGQGLDGKLRAHLVGIESLAVAADGSFSGSQKLSDTTTTIENGKLAGGVATGTVKVKSPGCTGTGTFKSRRAG